jgi:hypothetical protein
MSEELPIIKEEIQEVKEEVKEVPQSPPLVRYMNIEKVNMSDKKRWYKITSNQTKFLCVNLKKNFNKPLWTVFDFFDLHIINQVMDIDYTDDLHGCINRSALSIKQTFTKTNFNNKLSPRAEPINGLFFELPTLAEKDFFILEWRLYDDMEIDDIEIFIIKNNFIA